MRLCPATGPPARWSPAALGDSLGDAAALSVALAALGQGEGFTFAPAAP